MDLYGIEVSNINFYQRKNRLQVVICSYIGLGSIADLFAISGQRRWRILFHCRTEPFQSNIQLCCLIFLMHILSAYYNN